MTMLSMAILDTKNSEIQFFTLWCG